MDRTRATTRQVRRAASLVVGLLVVIAWPTVLAAPAGAHSELVSGTPRPGSVQDGMVAAVRLAFASELRPGLATIVVTRPGGRNRASGPPVVQDGRLTVALDPLDAAGSYDVSYRVVAADGHPITGTYRFEVSAAGAAAGRATAREAAESRGAPGETTRSREAAGEVALAAAGELPDAVAGPEPWGTDTGLVVVVAAMALVLGGTVAARTRSKAPEQPVSLPETEDGRG